MNGSSSLATLQRTPRGEHMSVRLPFGMKPSKQMATLRNVVTHLHHNNGDNNNNNNNVALKITTNDGMNASTVLPPMSPLTPAAARRSMQTSASLPLFKLPTSLSSSQPLSSSPSTSTMTSSSSSSILSHSSSLMSRSLSSHDASPNGHRSTIPYLTRHQSAGGRMKNDNNNKMSGSSSGSRGGSGGYMSDEQRAINDAIRLLYGMRAPPPSSSSTRELSPAAHERIHAHKELIATRRKGERRQEEKRALDEHKRHNAAIQAAIARQIQPEETLARYTYWHILSVLIWFAKL
jgi:hypothetical protein